MTSPAACAVRAASPVGRIRTALLVLLSLVAAWLPLGSSAELVAVVVRAGGDLAAAARAVDAVGGRALQPLPNLGMLLAEVPEDRIGVLATDPRVADVTPDRPITVAGAEYRGDGEATTAVAATGAVAAWEAGYTGEDVTVAVVDTGITPVPDLRQRLVAAFDVSGEGTPEDGYGHGTFMAGLIAGDGSGSGVVTGVAPDAGLVSVKVADAEGRTSLARVLLGLALVDVLHDRLDIDVVLLALAGPAAPGTDPLQVAVEQLWADGVVVVTAAGNDGPEPGSVASPGVDPYVITVGALDDAGTVDAGDDRVAPWSAVGPTPNGDAKPDLVAPGVSVVSLRAPRSTIDREYPDARVGRALFRGSGTSMSAALTAGAVALILDAHPGLTPDHVKGRLVGLAGPAPAGADPAAVGAGRLDVAAAIAGDAPPANQGLRPPYQGLEVYGDARGTDADHDDADEPERIEVLGWRWAGWRWTGWRWAGWRWADAEWAGWRWAGWRWADAEWAGWRWAGWRWAGWRWAANDWS